MAYQIDLRKIEEYILFLKKYKKKLEDDLVNFEKELKKAHEHWDDERYTLTIEAKDKIAVEQKMLIESTSKSIKNLTAMREQYLKYLRRK